MYLAGPVLGSHVQKEINVESNMSSNYTLQHRVSLNYDAGCQRVYLEDINMHHHLFCEVCIVCLCISSNVYIA